jgi:hypothetical protein
MTIIAALNRFALLPWMLRVQVLVFPTHFVENTLTRQKNIGPLLWSTEFSEVCDISSLMEYRRAKTQASQMRPGLANGE